MRSLPRPLVAALCALGLCSSAPALRASDMGIKTSPGRPALNRAAEPDADEHLGRLAKKPGTKPALNANEETIDTLRERLAEKLGAAQRGEGGDAGLLRVVARPVGQGAAPMALAPGEAPPAGIQWSDTQRRAGAGAAIQAAKPLAKKYPSQWAYQGEGGPENWAQMKPEYSLCGRGQRQSPIDIRDQITVQLDPVQFDYKPSRFRVIDNGHTVQVNVSSGNSIQVMGRHYELQQFHFHRPSESRIDGRQFDMDVHLVHKDLEGRVAVVAVLLERGSAQPVVQQVWNNLPLEKGEEVPAQAPIDLNGLLPSERGYFTFMGSLTTPPCSEGVLWMVMRTPVGVSSDQIGIFSRLYPMNARPVQAASGRLIKGSN